MAKLIYVLLMIALVGTVGCDSQDGQAEYRLISSSEAQEMMENYDVLILDVRTQEEFDSGFISNAVLLPYDEIGELAESVIVDRNRIVLVYCQRGRRSEIAARALVEMGFTRVYDFGGIEDWRGEVVWSATPTVFFNYFGEPLPPNVITPIDLTVTQRINEQMPEFTFRLTGYSEHHYLVNHNRTRFYRELVKNSVESITITDENGNLIQEITDLQTANQATSETMYGFSFDDWNFDGYLDISLWRFPGGSMLNAPTYFWLWDNSVGQFVRNADLEEFSDFSSLNIISESRRIEGWTRFGAAGGASRVYEYRDGRFIMVESWERNLVQSPYDEDEWVLHTVIRELINGEVVVVQEYFEEL